MKTAIKWVMPCVTAVVAVSVLSCSKEEAKPEATPVRSRQTSAIRSRLPVGEAAGAHPHSKYAAGQLPQRLKGRGHLQQPLRGNRGFTDDGCGLDGEDG